MKKTVLTIISLTIFFIAFSQSDNNQVTQGSIVYEEVMKLNIQLDNMTPEIEAMLPKESRASKKLYFNRHASRYQNIQESEDNTIENESDGGMVKIW